MYSALSFGRAIIIIIIVSFPATDRSRTYRSCRSFLSASSASSLSACRWRAFCRSINRPTGGFTRLTALLKVVTDITEAFDAGDHALLGLLDLSAPFDTVDHDVLVEDRK